MSVRRRSLLQRGRKPPYGTPIDWTDPITTQLRAAFMLGEGGGTVAYNSARLPICSATGLNAGGTWGNISTTNAWKSGKGGPAWSGVGGNSIDIGGTAKPAALNLPAQFTICARVYPTSVTSTHTIAIDDNAANSLNQWGLYTSAGKLNVVWTNQNGAAGNTALSANKWYDVAGLRGGVSGAWTAATYINGAFDSAGSGIVTAPGVQQGAAIGVAGNANSSFWNGLIEYVYIWARALSAGEIARIADDPYCFFDWPRHKSSPVGGTAAGPATYFGTSVGAGVGASGLVNSNNFMVGTSVIGSSVW
jgi:hypothetical protein